MEITYVKEYDGDGCQELVYPDDDCHGDYGCHGENHHHGENQCHAENGCYSEYGENSNHGQNGDDGYHGQNGCYGENGCHCAEAHLMNYTDSDSLNSIIFCNISPSLPLTEEYPCATQNIPQDHEEDTINIKYEARENEDSDQNETIVKTTGQQICVSNVNHVYSDGIGAVDRGPYPTEYGPTNRLYVAMDILRQFLHCGFFQTFNNYVTFLEKTNPHKVEYTIIKNIHLADWYGAHGDIQKAAACCADVENILGSATSGEDLLRVRYLTSKGCLMLRQERPSDGRNFLCQAAQKSQFQAGNPATEYAYQTYSNVGLLHCNSSDRSLGVPDDRIWQEAANYLEKASSQKSRSIFEKRSSRHLSESMMHQSFHWTFVFYLITLLRSVFNGHWYREYMEQCQVSQDTIQQVKSYLQYMKNHWSLLNERIKVYYYFTECDLFIRQSMLRWQDSHTCWSIDLLSKAKRCIDKCKKWHIYKGDRMHLTESLSQANVRLDFIDEKQRFLIRTNACCCSSQSEEVIPKEHLAKY